MKLVAITLLVIALMLIFAPVALAQDLPDTAVEGLNQAVIILITLGASLFGMIGTNFVKHVLPNLLPFLRVKDLDQLSKGWTQFVAVVIPALLTPVGVYLLPYAEALDDKDIWSAILAVVAVFGSRIIYRADKLLARWAH